MLAPHASMLAIAQETEERMSLLDILPWWWARLILGVVFVVIAGVAHKYEKAHPDSAANFFALPWIKTLFGIFGLLLIFEAIGII